MSKMVIECPKCKTHERVRIFCDIHVTFKQDANGVCSLIEDSIDPENVAENSVSAECMECDTKIALNEEQVNRFYVLMK